MATIKAIKEQLAFIETLEDSRWAVFEEDPRLGVQKAISQRRRAIVAEIAERERLEQMLIFERRLASEGFQAVAGIDEVGRGPLSGPVVAACVLLPQNVVIKGLDDSKKIPKSKHRDIYQEVMAKALAVGIGIKDNHIIDQVNIYEATKLAMCTAVEEVQSSGFKPDFLLVDAMTLPIDISQESLIKGDARSLSIAAASIVAKVTRDRLMADYDQIFPGYGFAKNAGYGTKEHIEGLKQHGVTSIHRQTFESVKSLIRGEN